jgi:uncharacterized damage-inducible protein DinB
MPMSDRDALKLRLTSQGRTVLAVVESAEAAMLNKRPPSDKWSAREHFAHVTRVHDAFVARVRRILDEETPLLNAYRAETDPEWPRWQQQSVDVLIGEFKAKREQILILLRGLDDADLVRRVGSHPLFGVMTLAAWFEFFLVHEAHHIYVMMRRARGAE